MQTDTIKQIAGELKKANYIWIIGNGGSAALADHFACDLLKNCGLRAVSLCSNSALCTAIGNDINFDDIFSEQLKVLLKPGDVLFCLSTSGKSNNILRAMKYAYSLKIEKIIIGVSSRSKGFFKIFSDILCHIQSKNMQECEDKMNVLCHKIYKELKRG